MLKATLFFLVALLPSRAFAQPASSHRTLLNTYCVTCHNETLRTAELLLDTADVEKVSSDAETWTKVVGMLKAEAMPPYGMPRPEKEAIDSFVQYLETELEKGSSAVGMQAGAEPAVQPVTSLESSNLASAHASPRRALLDRYCVTCHNEQLRTAELVLSSVDVDKVAEGAQVWEKVVRKLSTGAMPPAGMPRPDQAAVDSFVSYLETELDQAAEANPNPGRVAALHRFNRAEYANAIRDLLAVEVDGEALLPADDSGSGFDNFADLLPVSPLLTERYMQAARKISRIAIGDPKIQVVTEKYLVPKRKMQLERMSEDLPFGSRGGIAARHYFPLDGEYVLRIRLDREGNSYIRGLLSGPHQLDVRLDSVLIKQFTIAKAEGKSGPIWTHNGPEHRGETEDYEYSADDNLEFRFGATAGTHVVGATFPVNPSESEGMLLPAVFAADIDEYKGGDPDYKASPIGIANITITGPFNPTGPGDTPSRRKIFVCHPAAGDEEAACARRILSNLARRAYRRPVNDRDIEPLLELYREVRREEGFEAGIGTALQRVLVSPQFLFRMERDPANIAPGVAYRVSDLELASRLSFFLWSSIPDDELLDLAESGKLSEPAVLQQQVSRMLVDSRSKALVDNFAGQWLFLRNIAAVSPDQTQFPDFDENVREALHRETELFFENNLREDRPVVGLLDANYTFLNERLAQHYGIPNVYGSHFRRVTLSDESRKGLLGHGSILTVTSRANRTSPVLRGKWVMENVLGTPPPPPPPDVPPLQEEGQEAQNLTMRQRTERHRDNPVCAACHAQMDPIGFSLDNFNPTGQWRTSDGGAPIDASASLPDGTQFEGPTGLRQLLLDRSDQFVHTVTEKLLAYALGRQVEYYDAPAIRKILEEASADEYRWSSLALGIVKSTPFQMRRSRP